MQKSPLIWLDLEMTGLNPKEDHILEIASAITDNELNIIAQGPDIVIHQSDYVLETMNEWCKKQHARSGLVESVKKSTYTLQQAEAETLQFFQQHSKEGTALLCGNTIWQDRLFLAQYMPSLINWIHYRLIDVSAIKEVIQRWYPQSPYKDFKKNDNHRALEDVLQSIAELQHYRTHFFVSL